MPFMVVLLAALGFDHNGNSQPAPSALDSKESVQFATQSILATQLIQQQHIKPPGQSTLVDWAVRGLFDASKEPVPKALADRLTNAPQMKEAELLALLADARAALGKRDERCRCTWCRKPTRLSPRTR